VADNPTANDTAIMLQMSADLRGLQKAFDKAGGVIDLGSRRMEKRAKDAASGIEKAFGSANVGKALDKVFDNSRLKVFDTATARIGLTGGALEALGGAGLLAAAGLAAVTAGLVGAREAAKFADNINDAAGRLHVTTDALQEYREATRLAGGETAGADDALAQFSANLGKAQEGLKKSQRAFIALGFTQAQIKSFTDVDSALQAVTKKMEGLSNVQKDAIVDQLGLTGMKPLLEQGADGLDKLRQQARDLGLVMDASLVARGGELNDQFESVSKVIDLQLKQALVDLGPVLLDIMKMVGGIAGAFDHWAEGFKSVGDRSSSVLSKQAQADIATIGRLTAQRDRKGLLGGLGVFDKVELERAQAELPQIQAALKQRALTAAQNTPAVPKASLRDSTAEVEAQKAAEQALQRQELALRAQVDAANAAGNVAEAQRLKDKIDLLSKVKAYMSAGLTQAAAEIAAGRDLAVIQKARAAAQAEGIDQLQREAALRIAATAGDQATLDRLQREVDLEKLTAEYQKDGPVLRAGPRFGLG
jgi:hypothetical protein